MKFDPRCCPNENQLKLLAPRDLASKEDTDGESISRRTLTRTERRLLRRILKKASGCQGIWAESNSHVAKALGVNRSTVVRAVANFRAAGILMPVDTRGGRGRVSSYKVNLEEAKTLLKAGHWPGHPKTTAEEVDRNERLLGNPLRTSAKPAPFPEVGLRCDFDVGGLDDLVQRLRAEIKGMLEDPLLKRVLLFAGMCILDAFAIYLAWKKLGLAGALAVSLPAGLVYYKCLREVEKALQDCPLCLSQAPSADNG